MASSTRFYHTSIVMYLVCRADVIAREDLYQGRT